jgi:hypothetical protein
LNSGAARAAIKDGHTLEIAIGDAHLRHPFPSVKTTLLARLRFPNDGQSPQLNVPANSRRAAVFVKPGAFSGGDFFLAKK